MAVKFMPLNPHHHELSGVSKPEINFVATLLQNDLSLLQIKFQSIYCYNEVKNHCSADQKSETVRLSVWAMQSGPYRAFYPP